MRFEILGTLRVLAGSTEINVTARREQVLLAMLLMSNDQCLQPRQLAEAIWTARRPDCAADQIHGIVYRLRARLAAGGMPAGVIVTERGGYRAKINPDQVDMWEFRRLRAEARTAAANDRQTEAKRAYRTALGLWRGPALAGVDSPPLQQTALVLEEERLRTVEERVEIELGLGEAADLVVELTDLVQRHPYREQLHHALMLALYRTGRQAEALAAYRHARRIFYDELGTEPGAQLQELHQAILSRDRRLADLRPAPTSVARPPIPRELPSDVTGCIGRADAIGTLDRWWQGTGSAQSRIALITGTAGVGKTTLAVRWAHRTRDLFPDGQLYIDLQGYHPEPPLAPITALTRFLHALGTAPEHAPRDTAEAAARYRSLLADRRVLVVLDNAASPAQVRPLLPGSPGCLTLVTSRDQLGGLVARDGARRLTLDILGLPTAVALLSHLLGDERIRAEPAAAAELAYLCGYLPLALRIAAANLAARPGQRIADHAAKLRGQDGLAALAVAGDPLTAVTTTFDLTYSRLPDQVRRAFQILGLAPGPDVTADTIAKLAGITREEASDALSALASVHLAEERADGRYTCHDLLRRYAALHAGRPHQRFESGP